jgi:predicted 2-oxoglutarate/Fe(II)-dependent dioxygenase YbiX
MASSIRVIPNFVSELDCQKAVELLNTSNLYKFKYNDNVSIIPLRESEIDSTALIKKYSDKALYEIGVPGLSTVEGFLSLWRVGGWAGEHIDNHREAEFMTHSTVIYLNDDYEGGEIYFPKLNFKHKPTRGDAVIFPCSGPEYVHGVTEVTSGTRYTIPMWHSPIEEKAHPLLKSR